MYSGEHRLLHAVITKTAEAIVEAGFEAGVDLTAVKNKVRRSNAIFL
jgi:hypothetical protein